MTEKEIQLLGFSKVDVMDEKGGTYPYYYNYEITEGLSFESNNSSEDCAKEGKWYVQFKDTQEPIRFQKMEKVQALINTLEKAKI